MTAGDYQALTGREPPPSPITAETYARQGLPWFELDDRGRGTLGSTSALTNVRPIHESGVAPGKGGQPAGPASETGGPAPAETLTPESTAPLSESEDLISPTP